MKRRHVVVLSAGAALAFGCAKDDPPEQAVPVALPAWDDVPSGHPEGATNPPMPELVVTPEGDCFKRWVSPMKRPTGPRGNRVEACVEDCGTAIVCPPEAEALLAAWRAEQGADAADE